MSLRGLRTFCVAAGHESFRAAADDLFVTASAVSHQIRSLEDELGLQLFERSARSLNLTETGRSLYDEIRPMIEGLDSIVARHRVAGMRRSLRISVQPFFASELFVPRLHEFTRAYPEYDIQVDTSDETSEKHPSNSDISIRLFRSRPANLVSDLLFPLRLVPAGSPGFRDRMKMEGGKVVGEFPTIVHDTRPRAWGQWARSSGISLPADANTIRLDSMIAIARAAERGLGAALVPVPLSDAWFESGSLVQLFEHELVTTDGYYIVCASDRIKDDNVRVLRDWVLQSFDGHC
jgi:LysR family glycine cleavage system transcriptional activator